MVCDMNLRLQKILVLSVVFTFLCFSFTPSAQAEESEPTYWMDSDVDFNNLGWVMPGTSVPVSVEISKMNELETSHMIAIHFQTDGHDRDRHSVYLPSMDSSDLIEVTGEIHVTSGTTNVDIELEVLLRVDDPCDMNKPVEERFEAEPHSSQIVSIDSNIPSVVQVQALTTLPAEPTRFTFDYDDSNGQAEDGFWSISVTSNQMDLPIHGMNLCINWIDSQGEYNQEIWNLANNTVYGFNPTNSESSVTFYDVINMVNGNAVATYGTGDTIYIRSQDDAGLGLEDVGMSVVYDFSSSNAGAILGIWGNGCSFDWDSDGVSATDAFPFDSSEQTDSDDDGVGDNTDAFPEDPNETVDSDGDGVGDNADLYPNDATKSSDEVEEEESEKALPSIGILATLSMVLLAMIPARVLNSAKATEDLILSEFDN